MPEGELLGGRVGRTVCPEGEDVDVVVPGPNETDCSGIEGREVG